jgi:acetyl-CoA acetyltransferase family protein
MGASMAEGKYGLPFGRTVTERYADTEYIPGFRGLVPQGISAEIISEKWGLSREDLDGFGLRSQQFAARARDEGRYDNEVVPVREVRLDRESGNTVEGSQLVTTDEGIRDTSMEALANLKPAFRTEGVVTAGNSSQITDGSAAVLIMTEEKANELGLRPRARFVEFSLAGADPVMMLTAPIPATEKVLERAKLTLDDMDLIEINEAFAAVVLAWEKELHPDLERVNVNGGAIALGHPLGASGARLCSTLLNELERTGGRYALQTICEGGGLANAFIIERLG